MNIPKLQRFQIYLVFGWYQSILAEVVCRYQIIEHTQNAVFVALWQVWEGRILMVWLKTYNCVIFTNF